MEINGIQHIVLYQRVVETETDIIWLGNRCYLRGPITTARAQYKRRKINWDRNVLHLDASSPSRGLLCSSELQSLEWAKGRLPQSSPCAFLASNQRASSHMPVSALAPAARLK